MIFRSREDLIAAGWTEGPADGFAGHVGPTWELIDGDEAVCGFLAEAKHRNRSHVVQGGMLATLADRALGLTARLSQPARVQATIQLNMQYIGPARLGEFITARGSLLNQTRNLAFLSGRLEADGRLVGHASGVWRIRPDKVVSA